MRPYLNHEPAITSFVSEKVDIEIINWISPGETSNVDLDAPDMVAMANWAMHYLVCNPQKPLDYECRFAISPLAYPPTLGDNEHDEVAVGDSESRIELAYVYMREMTGMTVGRQIEQKIRDRLVSYIRDDGLCWCSSYCSGSGITKPAAMTWATSYLLRSTMERYVRNGDEKLHKLGRRLVNGLKSLATRQGNMMWYEGGMAAYSDGCWHDACNCHPPSIISSLVSYWKITGEDDVLEFAEGMAEGIIAGMQPHLGKSRIQPDGSHSSPNGHLTMRGLLGVAELGQLTGNSRFVEYVRKTYEFNRATGTDWGWYPENIFERDRRYYSETCFACEMVESAIAIANSGYPEYWDHIERTVRNYLSESQFFVTPEYEAVFRELNPDLEPEKVDIALRLMRKYEGGFLARLTPNDRVYTRNGKLQMSMMGCCPPEGMRALYHAWANTVIDKGEEIMINMCLDHDSEVATVRSFAPRQGKLEIQAKKGGIYHVRPPAWTPQDQVQVRVNKKTVQEDWHGSYLRFENVNPGDCIQIDYALLRFQQRQPVGYDGAEEIYHVNWIGNDIESVSPAGQYLPIFQSCRQLPPLHNIEEWESTEIIDMKSENVLSDLDWKPD